MLIFSLNDKQLSGVCLIICRPALVPGSEVSHKPEREKVQAVAKVETFLV